MIQLVPDEWQPIAPAKIQIEEKHHILTDEIVKYVFANLGITEVRKVSVKDNMFKSDKTISFIEDSDNPPRTVPVFACRTKVGDKKLEIVSVVLTPSESAVLVRLEGCPMYGAYFWMGDGRIGVCIKDHWVKASMFVQASFLAGMEQLKEVGYPFEPMKKFDDMYDALKKFLECEL
jgi:hypothetical protein